MNLLLVYLLVMNILAFITVKVDKQKAIHHAYRISEKSLFFLALIGGSIGLFIGMYLFHHKTKKKRFTIGISFLVLLQFIIYLYMHS